MSKKNFSNAIEGFISKPEEIEQTTLLEKEEIKHIEKKEIKAKKYSVEKPETKSRRVQWLIKPSTHKALEKTAKENKISVNELINIILENEMKE